MLPIFFSSCENLFNSGGGGSTNYGPVPPNSVRIRGTVPSMESVNSITNSHGRLGSRSIGSAISHIAAIPLIAASLDIKATEEFEVADDGTFSADLSKENEDYLLILKDSSLPEAEQVQGYLALPYAEESLISMPVGEALLNDLDVGNLQFTGNEAISELDIAAYDEYFSLPGQEIEDRALSDDMLKRARNLWLCDHDTWNVLPFTHFHWTGPLGKAANQWTTPDIFKSFDGWYSNIHIFNFEEAIFTNEDVLNGSVILAYHIPGDQTLIAVDGSSVTEPFTSSDITPQSLVLDPDIPVGEETSYIVEGEELFISVTPNDYSIGPTHPFLDLPVPEGDWTVTANGEEIARYDIVLGSPVDEDAHIRAPVPSVRFETDPDDRVIGVSIGERYVYSQNSSDYVVINESTLESLFGASDVRIWFFGETGEEVISEFFGTSNSSDGIDSSEMEYEWYYGIDEAEVPDGGYLLTTLFFSYDAQDADMCFTLSNQ